MIFVVLLTVFLICAIIFIVCISTVHCTLIVPKLGTTTIILSGGRNMKKTLSVLIGLIVFAGTSSAQDANVRRNANAAFEDFDSEIVKHNTSQRAELRAYIKSEITLLELDLAQTNRDSTRVVAIMDIAKKYVVRLMSDSTIKPQALSVEFHDFITGYRARLKLNTASSPSNAKSLASVKPMADSVLSTHSTTTALVGVPSLSVAAIDVASAQAEANWSTNIQDVPKDIQKYVGKTWVSKDSLVTFAVGKGQSSIVQLARTTARINASNVLARGGRTTGVIQIPSSGVSIVRYTPSDKDGVVYCLVAIPTALLSK